MIRSPYESYAAFFMVDVGWDFRAMNDAVLLASMEGEEALVGGRQGEVKSLELHVVEERSGGKWRRLCMKNWVVDETDYKRVLRALRKGDVGALMEFAEGNRELRYLEAEVVV